MPISAGTTIMKPAKPGEVKADLGEENGDILRKLGHLSQSVPIVGLVWIFSDPTQQNEDDL